MLVSDVARSVRSRGRACVVLVVVTGALAACFEELPVPLEDSATNDAAAPDATAPQDAASSADGAPIGDAARPTDAASADGGSPYAQVVLADEPLAYWRFDEDASSPVAHDATGHGNTLTFGGTGVVLGVPGALPDDDDTALTLDIGGGLPSYADGGSLFRFAGTEPFTFELWAKASLGSTNYLEILGRTDLSAPPTLGYLLSVEPGGGCVIFQRLRKSAVDNLSSCGSPSTTELTATGPWVHLVVTYDGAQMMFFSGNGAMPNVSSSTGAIPDGGLGPFLVGGNEGNFSGSLDELAVYDHALSQAQIAQHYAASGH